MAGEEWDERPRGFRVGFEELARRAVRIPTAMLLFGPPIFVVVVMLAREAWPALKTAGDLFDFVVYAAAVALWFFGRLAYFALVGVPADGEGPRVRRSGWWEAILLTGGVILAVAAFIAMGLLLNPS